MLPSKSIFLFNKSSVISSFDTVQFETITTSPKRKEFVETSIKEMSCGGWSSNGCASYKSKTQHNPRSELKGLQKYGSLLRWWDGEAGRGQKASHLAFTATGKVHKLRPNKACFAKWRCRGVIVGAEWIGTAGRGYDLSCGPYLRTATRFGHSC